MLIIFRFGNILHSAYVAVFRLITLEYLQLERGESKKANY